jgi:hypothetical protein
VDVGSTGYADIAGLRQYVIKPSATRIYALVDIGARGTLLGLIGNYANLDLVNAQLTARAAETNKPDVVEIKVRLSREITGPNDLEILKNCPDQGGPRRATPKYSECRIRRAMDVAVLNIIFSAVRRTQMYPFSIKN